MYARAIRFVMVSSLAVGTFAVAPGGAIAAPGTWTRITAGTTIMLAVNGTTQLPLAGKASADVTGVDIICIDTGPAGPAPQALLASNVPVTNGMFATTGNLATLVPQCRLRALPTGLNPFTNYLGSYRGPILYPNGINVVQAGGVPAGFGATVSTGEDFAEMADAGDCGPFVAGTVEVPSMLLRTLPFPACSFGFPTQDLHASGGPTGTSISVDGHSAYLPSGVAGYLNTTLLLGLTQPKLTATFTQLAHGDARVTESAHLMRCSVDDTYPPTTASCPSLVDTGVRFSRVTDIVRGAQQFRLRDTFAATDGHAHAVVAQYFGGMPQFGSSGSVGYTFPGGSAKFHASSLGQTVSGLGTKAGTMFVRSDMFSDEGDLAAGTVALTWSRAPQKVQFSPTQINEFGMRYPLTVSSARAAHIGFAFSGHYTTAVTKSLAAVAESEMVNPPSISSPPNRATIHGHTTTVKGRVTIGANGLPTKVTVNGHVAQLTTVSATKATYHVSFSEAFGKHTIKVTARDAVGNTRSNSITVTNASP